MTTRRRGNVAATAELLEQRLVLSALGSGNPQEVYQGGSIDPYDSQPYSRAVELHLTWDSNGNNYRDSSDYSIVRSGALVSDYHVLTSARNLFDREAFDNDVETVAGGLGEVRWVEAYGGPGSHRELFLALGTDVSLPTSWTNDTIAESELSSHDYGLVHLDRNMGQVTGYFDYHAAPDSDLQNETAFILGYQDRSFSGGTLHLSTAPIQEVAPTEFRWDLSDGAVYYPFRGGAVYVESVDIDGTPTENVLVGLLNRHDGDDSFSESRFASGDAWGTRITSSIASTIDDWVTNSTAPVGLPELVDFDEWRDSNTSTVSTRYPSAGGEFTATARVFNASPEASPGVNVNWYFGNFLVGTSTSGPIGGYRYRTVTFDGPAPDSIPYPASYQLRWEIDPDDDIPEMETRIPGTDLGRHWGPSLTLTQAALTPDIYEPNDSGEGSTDLGTLTESLLLQDLTLHNGDDQDFYTFVAGASGQYTITTSGVDPEDAGNVRIRMYRPGVGTSIFEDTLTLTEGETLVVQVYGYRGTVSSYDLSIRVPDVFVDRYEPNDEEPVELGWIGEFVEEELSLHSSEDRDLFNFTAGVTGELAFDLNYDEASEHVVADLRTRQNGRSIGSTSATHTSFRVWVERGTPYVLDIRSPNDAVKNYDVSLVITEPETPPHPLVVQHDSVTGRLRTVQLNGSHARFQEYDEARWAKTPELTGLMLGDFNGDGLLDALGREDTTPGYLRQWRVALGQVGPEGNTFGQPQVWSQWYRNLMKVDWLGDLAADFNGDGKTDIISLNENGGLYVMFAAAGGYVFETPIYVGGLPGTETWTDVSTGDFNGDGHTDLIARSQQSGEWWGLLRNAANDGFEPAAKLEAWRTDTAWLDVQIADIDADGIDDVIGRAASGGGWFVMRGRSGGLFAPEEWVRRWDRTRDYRDVSLGDFNGDGWIDVTGRVQSTGEWTMMTGQQTGGNWTGFAEPEAWATWDGWRRQQPWIHTRSGDFDGDGKADIVSQARAGGGWWLMTANETGTAFDAPTYLDIWSQAETWEEVFVGDFNGDTGTTGPRLDLIGFSQLGKGWVVAESDATEPGGFSARYLYSRFDPLTTWRNFTRGDFDGDGDDDILAWRGADNRFHVALNHGGRFGTPRDWGVDLSQPWQRRRTWDDLQVADLDGDGDDDIVLRNDRGAFYLFESTGQSFRNAVYYNIAGPQTNGLAPTEISEYHLIDVSGDGRADLVSYSESNERFYYAQARSQNEFGFYRNWTSVQLDPNYTWVDIRTGDVNNDGRQDLVVRLEEGGGWHALYAKPAGNGLLAPKWIGRFDPSVNWGDVVLADFTDNGRLDLIGRDIDTGKRFVMAYNTGTDTYDAPISWPYHNDPIPGDVYETTLVADFSQSDHLDVLHRTEDGNWYLFTNHGYVFAMARVGAGWNPERFEVVGVF